MRGNYDGKACICEKKNQQRPGTVFGAERVCLRMWGKIKSFFISKKYQD